MRKIIIGDVHGCYDELVVLLEKIKYDRAADAIFFVGDYTDRGKQNVEVADFVRELKNECGERCVLIRGNHEEMMREYFEEHGRDWTRSCNGGHKTLADFEDKNAEIKDWLNFVKENTVFYCVAENFQIVHAGLFEEDPSLNSNDTLIWDRDPIKYGLYKGKLTIVGHTPFQSPALIVSKQKEGEIWDWSAPDPIIYEYNKWYDLPDKGLLNIDTGCVFENKLTALIIEDDKMIFSSNTMGE